MNPQKVLVDTDVLIDFLRRKPIAKQILDEVSSLHDLYISVVTLAEILAGMRPSEEEATETLLQGLTFLPVTERIGRRAGHLRRQLSSRKLLLPDCLIASTAIEENCLLLTFNKKDYQAGTIRFYPVGSQ